MDHAPLVPHEWDVAADVVVVGFGAAGFAASVTAHDLGAEQVVEPLEAEHQVALIGLDALRSADHEFRRRRDALAADDPRHLEDCRGAASPAACPT